MEPETYKRMHRADIDAQIGRKSSLAKNKLRAPG
jgi:hypothetical protein